jgi:hypothetical protein
MAGLGGGGAHAWADTSQKEPSESLFSPHNQWQMDNFWAQKPVKGGGDVLLDLYCTKSYFWAKAYMAFEPFG